MNKEDFDQYIEGRYNDQVKWYDNKAIKNKRLNYILQVPIIAIAAVIPIFAVLEEKWVTIILSALVAVLIGLANFGKFDEKWHNYRTTCELLKKEIYYYKMGINVYKDTESREELFAERVEALISSEHTKWTTIEKCKKFLLFYFPYSHSTKARILN